MPNKSRIFHNNSSTSQLIILPFQRQLYEALMNYSKCLLRLMEAYTLLLFEVPRLLCLVTLINIILTNNPDHGTTAPSKPKY